MEQSTTNIVRVKKVEVIADLLPAVGGQLNQGGDLHLIHADLCPGQIFDISDVSLLAS